MAPALLTLGALFAGAALTAWLEPRLLGEREGGPAVLPPPEQRARPEPNDPWMYHAAPVVAVLGAAFAMVVVPWSPTLVGADLGIGLFYFIVVVDFVVLAVALGGWGAKTFPAVEAAYRMVAQLVAYVVPLGLAIIGPIMMARSMSTVDIVTAQSEAGLWYAVPQPLGLALYLVTGAMQSYRRPFLEPFAERLGRGVAGQYVGWGAALWRIALSGVLFVVAAMGAVLFLGGYAGPWLPGPVWMLLKTLVVLGLLVGLGRRFEPRTTAQTLALAWKVLIPVGLVNVLVVGGLILLGVGQGPFTP